MERIILGNNIISEKSVNQTTAGKYVVEVLGKTNKSEIKKEIEKRFKVKVIKVNSLNYSGKKRIFRRIPGQSKLQRRMLITLGAGQKIRDFEFDTKEKAKTDKTISKKNPVKTLEKPKN